MSELEVKHADFAKRLNEMMSFRRVDKVKLSDLSKISYEMIRRYCEGTAKPRDKNLTKIAAVLDASVSYLSFGELPKTKDLAEPEHDGVNTQSINNRELDNIPTAHIIVGGESGYPLVDILYLDIKASCGSGYVNLESPDAHTQAFTVEFLRANDLPTDGKGLVLMHACNDSMGYTIPDGTLMLVNTNEREYDNFINDKIYVFNADGEMMCKRAIKRLNGTVLIKSDNTDKDTYPDDVITRDTFNNFDVFGRVRYTFAQH